jgi:hypothetical protein
MATKKTDTKEKVLPLPTSWEEFCEQTGRNPLLLPDTSVYEENKKAQAIANFKLNLLIPYCNKKQLTVGDRHYEIWWDMEQDATRPSGVGLRYHGYDLWYTITYCGPRSSKAHGKILPGFIAGYVLIK